MSLSCCSKLPCLACNVSELFHKNVHLLSSVSRKYWLTHKCEASKMGIPLQEKLSLQHEMKIYPNKSHLNWLFCLVQQLASTLNCTHSYITIDSQKFTSKKTKIRRKDIKKRRFLNSKNPKWLVFFHRPS